MSGLSGQTREVIFTSFPADSVSRIILEIPDSLVVQTWFNTAVFVETEITMSGCPENTLKHTIGQGRYALQQTRENGTLRLRPAVERRGGLTTPRGYCEEQVLFRIYVPADFNALDVRNWEREEETSKTTINY